MATIETDYLVVGGGAAGMAFADSLDRGMRGRRRHWWNDVTARADTGTAPTRSCACINRQPSTG